MSDKINGLTHAHEQLYNLLGEGKENAQTRTMLAIRMGCTDRRVRKLIEELSTCGLVVCNVQDGAGYYKPNTEEDYEAIIKLETARARALRKKVFGVKLGLYEFLKAQEERAER